jgi:O-antigen/teichoic acid export membrane protein
MTVETGSAALKAASRRDLVTSARNAITLGASLMATWSVALIVRFHLPRHLGPEDFGTFNFCDSFAAAFSIFLGLGLETYIQKEIPVRPEHASEFFGGVIALRAALSASLLALMTGVLLATHRPSSTVHVALVFGLAQYFIGLNATLSTMLQASTRVGRLAVSNVLGKLVWATGIVVGIWLHASLFALALPMLVAELLRTMLLYPTARRELALVFRLDAHAVRAVVIASVPFYVNTIAISLGARLDVSMLEFLSSDKEVGWYSAANNFASLAMLLSPVVSWVLLPLLSRAAKRSHDEVFTIVRRSIEGLVVLSIPVTMVIALGADLWVRVVFGAKFAAAAVSLRVLAPIFVLTYIAILLASALIILGRSWTLTFTSLIGLASLPVFIWLLVPLTARLGPGGAGTGAALGQIAMETLTVTLFLGSVGRRAFDRRSLVAIGKSLAVCAMVVGMHPLLEPLGHARIAVEAAAYACLAVAVGAIRFREVTSGIRAIMSERRSAKTEA